MPPRFSCITQGSVADGRGLVHRAPMGYDRATVHVAETHLRLKGGRYAEAYAHAGNRADLHPRALAPDLGPMGGGSPERLSPISLVPLGHRELCMPRLGRLAFEGVYALSSYAGMTTSNTSSHDLPAANSCLSSSSKDRMTSRPIARPFCP
jgi:hypothetical protein